MKEIKGWLPIKLIYDNAKPREDMEVELGTGFTESMEVEIPLSIRWAFQEYSYRLLHDIIWNLHPR